MPRLAFVALCAVLLTAFPALASDPSARSAASVPSVPVKPVPVAILDESTVSASPLEVGSADLVPPPSESRCVFPFLSLDVDRFQVLGSHAVSP